MYIYMCFGDVGYLISTYDDPFFFVVTVTA